MKSRKTYLQFLFLTCCILSICTLSCTKKEAAKPGIVVDEEKLGSGFIRVTLDSKEIAGNQAGIHTYLDTYVYLPESYENSGTEYAVLYYLHGYEGSPRNITQYLTAIKEYNSTHSDKELIFVGVSGYNSFYTNSRIRGNWENHIMKEVLPYIDSTYRTVKTASGRIIAGFSMGGYGAIKLGLAYPDTFSLVYAHTPGLFDENGLKNAYTLWDDTFKRDYAQTFSYKDNGDLEMPAFDGSEQDTEIIRKWESGFGGINEMLDTYEKHGSTLKSIKVVYGIEDQLYWIINGSKYFISELEKRNINHTHSSYKGGHQFSQQHFKEELLDFVIHNL